MSLKQHLQLVHDMHRPANANARLANANAKDPTCAYFLLQLPADQAGCQADGGLMKRNAIA
eukprot:16340-Heterococcus_DN1.PRE.2